MKADVLCVGHASYDIITYVSQYPAENSKAETDRLIESGGGPASNAAYLLSMWGAKCAIAAGVGDDDYARRILDELREVGADTRLVDSSADRATPVSLIVVNTRNGSRSIVNRKSQHSPLRLDPVVLESMNPNVLLFDGHELEASLQAMQAFPNAITILDAGSLREGTEKLAPKVNYLVCSERFACQITGISSMDSIEDHEACVKGLTQVNGNIVVVTLGERGLVYSVGNGIKHLPAYTAQAIDTTAAGDIFHGAFAYGIAQNMALEETLKLASMASSLSVQRPGGRASIPTLNELRGLTSQGFKDS